MALTPALSHLLHTFGLQEVMTSLHAPDFQVYVPQDYPGSERAHMDEVHRMSELVLLHPRTGLRLEYLRSESYFGDEVRCRFRSAFIITLAGETHTVLDMDEDQQSFTTPAGTVAFHQVSKTVATPP